MLAIPFALQREFEEYLQKKRGHPLKGSLSGLDIGHRSRDFLNRLAQAPAFRHSQREPVIRLGYEGIGETLKKPFLFAGSSHMSRPEAVSPVSMEFASVLWLLFTHLLPVVGLHLLEFFCRSADLFPLDGYVGIRHGKTEFFVEARLTP